VSAKSGELHSRDPQRGIGLHNMRERMASIDGELQLISQPGFTVVVAALSAAAVRRFAQP